MIGKFLAILLAGVVICSEVSDLELKSEFASFITTFGKNYQSAEELAYRFSVFSQNYKDIVENNEKIQSESDLELGVNQFSDLTMAEIKERYLTYAPSRYPCKEKHKKIQGDPKINWSKKVTRVKNQGNCGSCWAFSTTGSLEGVYAIANKLETAIEFSEQELVDCAGKYGDNAGCQGGDMCQAFDYIKDNGLSTAKEYPYEGRNGKCRKKSSFAKIKDCVNVTSMDNDELLEALTWGPVSIAVIADNREFMWYRRGIIKSGCTGKELDHGITLVGAGNEENTDYWLVKNSWGTTWGLSGYAKIKRDTGKSKGICWIAMENCYPVL